MIVISDTFSHYIYNSNKSTLLSPNSQNLWLDLTIKQITFRFLGIFVIYYKQKINGAFYQYRPIKVENSTTTA